MPRPASAKPSGFPVTFRPPTSSTSSPESCDAPESLDQLVQALERHLRVHPEGPACAGLLAAYVQGAQDWQACSYFGAGSYSRNLIQRTRRFELLLLCWGEGASSPIHNHEGQRCWMAVLDGPMEEVHFRRQDGAASGPLEPGPVRRFETGQVTYIEDEIALHLVRAMPGRRSISLHVYARPFDACNVYCEQTGELSSQALDYDSIRGVPLAD